MNKILTALAVLLLIAGVALFLQGPTENQWTLFAWGAAFVLGVVFALLGLRRGARGMRVLNGLLLVPHSLLAAFFVAVLVMRLA